MYIFPWYSNLHIIIFHFREIQNAEHHPISHKHSSNSRNEGISKKKKHEEWKRKTFKKWKHSMSWTYSHRISIYMSLFFTFGHFKVMKIIQFSHKLSRKENNRRKNTEEKWRTWNFRNHFPRRHKDIRTLHTKGTCWSFLVIPNFQEMRELSEFPIYSSLFFIFGYFKLVNTIELHANFQEIQ